MTRAHDRQNTLPLGGGNRSRTLFLPRALPVTLASWIGLAGFGREVPYYLTVCLLHLSACLLSAPRRRAQKK